MALSFALHGLALGPLLVVGASGIAPGDEPALLVEITRAAPAPTDAAETGIDLPAAEVPPPVDAAEIVPTTVDLPLPDEPPPLDTTGITPIEPPRPQPQPRPQPKPQPTPPATAAPVRAAQKSPATQTVSPPDTGTAQATQAAAAAPEPTIVLEHHPRFRSPPRPAAYPPRAVELGQQGEALVRVRLDTSGSAVEIVLWRGSGHELLDKAALAAVRGWQFLPALRNGRAIAAWVEIPVRFHLR